MSTVLAKKFQLLDAVRSKSYTYIERLLKEICPDLNIKINKDTYIPVSQAIESHIEKIKDIYRSLTIEDIKRILFFTNRYGKFPNGMNKELYVENLLRELMRCKNAKTMVMDEPILNLDPRKLFITPYRYCHSIDELLDYLMSSPYGDLDPLGRSGQKIWNDDEAKEIFLNHPHLDRQNVKQLRLKMGLPDQKPKKPDQKPKKPDQMLREEFFKAIDLLGKLGFLLLFLKRGQKDARIGEVAMSNYITNVLDELSPVERQKIYDLKDNYGKTVREIFDHIDTCLHDKGFWLLTIYRDITGRMKQRYPYQFWKYPSDINRTIVNTILQELSKKPKPKPKPK
uniref:Uncharacterized protein n=1 Tax=viral metagenome TaxID=1070528 RepID=A0A6C0K4A4_9ZZZZ